MRTKFKNYPEMKIGERMVAGIEQAFRFIPLVGITDQAEPADPTSVVNGEYEKMLFNIIVTKGIPCGETDKYIKANPELVIMHWTITGLGGTALEPHVVNPFKQFERIENYIGSRRIPRDHCYIRVDPIFPCKEGIGIAKAVIAEGYRRGFRLFRYSWLDVYGHVKDRFTQVGCTLDIEWGADDRTFVNSMINEFPGITLVSCAEVDGHCRGCVSPEDFKMLGFDPSMAAPPTHGQRRNCQCVANKYIILVHDGKPCMHSCLYCYWKGGLKNPAINKPLKEVLENIERDLKKGGYQTEPKRKIIKFFMGNKKYAENNWLSNMYPVDIMVNNMTFSCVEAAFQAFKFGDISEQKRFVGVSGFEAKSLGGKNGKLSSFIGENRWNKHKVWVMAQFLMLKFGNPQYGGIYQELHDKLIATGNAYLLEDGRDNFWGGKENMLGKLLMLLREYLRNPKNVWDIFSSDCDILTNLNNCQVRKDGTAIQGAGLAAAFEKNPTFNEDNAAFSKYLRENSAQPGDIFSTDRVLYAMTKLRPSRDEKITLETIISLSEKFPKIMTEKHAGKSLAIPRVGSGLAGGNWLDIFPYLLSGFEGYSNGQVVMSGVELYPYGASISPTER